MQRFSIEDSSTGVEFSIAIWSEKIKNVATEIYEIQYQVESTLIAILWTFRTLMILVQNQGPWPFSLILF